ncbi:MAG: hypothetical protein Q6K08_04715, partial [Thermostichales cyanobacterium GMQP_bins_62]
PTFRLPTLIHTRSGNAKHLTELAHTHPLLVYPEDAERMGVATNDLVRVETADRVGGDFLEAAVVLVLIHAKPSANSPASNSSNPCRDPRI